MALPQKSLLHFALYTVVNVKLKGGSPKGLHPPVLALCIAVCSCCLKLTWDGGEKMCQVHKISNIRITGTVVCNLRKNKQIKENKLKKNLIKTILIAYNYIKHNYTQTYTYILHYITM